MPIDGFNPHPAVRPGASPARGFVGDHPGVSTLTRRLDRVRGRYCAAISARSEFYRCRRRGFPFKCPPGDSQTCLRFKTMHTGGVARVLRIRHGGYQVPGSQNGRVSTVLGTNLRALSGDCPAGRRGLDCSHRAAVAVRCAIEHACMHPVRHWRRHWRRPRFCPEHVPGPRRRTSPRGCRSTQGRRATRIGRTSILGHPGCPSARLTPPSCHHAVPAMTPSARKGPRHDRPR